VRATLRKTVGEDRRVKVVLVETLKICLGVSLEALSTGAVSVEMPTIQVETKARAGLDRETAEGSCRATSGLPAATSKRFSTIYN
jgi:hypothetical protein